METDSEQDVSLSHIRLRNVIDGVRTVLRYGVLPFYFLLDLRNRRRLSEALHNLDDIFHDLCTFCNTCHIYGHETRSDDCPFTSRALTPTLGEPE